VLSFSGQRELRQVLRILALCIVLVFSLSACTTPETTPQQPGAEIDDQEPGGGVLRVAITAYPPSMDPSTAWTHLGSIVTQHVTESLVTYAEDWSIIPCLAEDYWSNDDATEWTFTLRQGVPFHNGSVMTSADVKASFDRFLSASPRASDLANLDRIEIVDDYTVVLYMSAPTPILPAFLAYPMAGVFIMPEEVLAGLPDTPLPPDKIVGTGPYRLANAVPDMHIILEKFEQYAQDDRFDGPTGYGGFKTAYFDEIRLIPVPEASSRVAGILTGDYDFAQDLPKNEYESLLQADGVVALVNPAQWMPVFYLNQRQPPFDNLSMRRALQYTFDMNEIMFSAAQLEDFYRIDSSLFFQEQVWHCDIGTELGLYNSPDHDKVRELLDEAGYNDEPIIFITNPDYDWMHRSAIVAADQMQQAGFNVRLEVYDWPTAISVRNTTDNWHIFVSGDSMPYDGSYMNYWHTDQDWLGYSNPRVDELLEEGMSHTDFDTRYAVYCEFSKVVYEDVVYIKLGDLHELHGLRDNLKGYRTHTALRFWDTYID